MTPKLEVCFNPMKTEVQKFSTIQISSRAPFLAVFLAVGLAQFWALDQMSFHGDESDWLTMGINAITLVLAGRLHDPLWFGTALEHGGIQFFQGPVTMYLLGLTLRLFGIQSGEWIYWYSGRTDVPPLCILLLGRAVISLTGYLTLFMVYLLGKELKNTKTGLIAVILLGLHPLWLICSRRAMSDTPAILFSTLAMLCFCKGLKTKGRAGSMIVVLSGVALGLAIDSKYTSISLGAILLWYVASRLVLNYWKPSFGSISTIRLTKNFGLLGLAAVITTVLLNPVLYPNPVGQLLKIASYWQSTPFFSHSIVVHEKPYVGAAGFEVMILGVFHTLVFPGVSLLKEFWQSYQWSWDWPGSFTTATTSLFFMIGVIALCIKSVGALRKRVMVLPILLLFWLIGEILFAAATVRVMFDRYFLPVLPPLILVAAIGLTSVDEAINLKLRTPVPVLQRSILPLFLSSHAVNLLAFYPQLYEGAWSNPGNWPQLGTIQQSIGTPFGQFSLFLFVLAVASTTIVVNRRRSEAQQTKLNKQVWRLPALNPNSRIWLVAFGLLSIIPAFLLLWYIALFGVNVIFWDEWEVIPLIQKAMSGTLSFSNFFAQHNEHRILFPRIVMLALGGLTQYNTVADMFFSWILMCLTGLLIFYLYRKKFFLGSYPKLLLVFLPVSLLLFGFRQYESILWGFTCQMYLMIFGAVATFTLLELSKKIDIWFILCLSSAILATFSFSVGLSVWPAGLLQIFISEKRSLRKAVIWCFAGAVAFTSYFYGYVKPSHHPPLNYVLIHPLGAGRYFLTLIGAPFSYDAVTAAVLGLVISLIAILVIVEGYNGKLLKGYGVWLSFILFVAISSAATTGGRAGFGVEQALSSRYTPLTVLGVVGLYFLAVSVSEKLPAKSKSFGAHALLALILVGLIVSYGGGWQAGQNMKYSREMGAYVLTTYKIQSDENIRNYLYPIPTVVREQAEFLELNKLNVFSEKAMNLSTLILSSSNTLFALDTINGKIVSQQITPLVINSSQQGTITITGWAVDEQANDVATTVFITIDGRIDIPTLYGLDRQDVANYFKNANFRFSGYIATFSTSILGEGEHTISLKIVSKDGIHYYYPEQRLYLLVN